MEDYFWFWQDSLGAGVGVESKKGSAKAPDPEQQTDPSWI